MRAAFVSVLTAALIFIAHDDAYGQMRNVVAGAAGEERITIDGRLTEEAWIAASPAGELMQVLPKEGTPARERTDIRVLVDRDALYFGITCFDREPSAIVASQLTRDADLDVDDHILIVLDPFFDQRNGFFFSVNPAGARADGQVSNNSEHANRDWDGIWNAEARITDEGWVAEIAIPFKTLRFRPGQESWGLNVQRLTKRYNEIDRWSGVRRDVWPYNMAEAGRLDGIPALHQGRGLDIRPYGVLRKRDEDGSPATGGIDFSQNLTPNLNASLSLNTDFAETEVDARQINLTRFPLFYPEKRAFFLEGGGVFETNIGPPFVPDLIPFFSRRIGLMAGREVPIIAGAKLTGRLSHYNVGLLDVQTGAVDDVGLASQNLLAARVSRNIWRQSYVGGIFTHGNPAGGGSNSLVGADARFATSQFRGDKNLSLSLFYFATKDADSNSSDRAAGFSLEYPNDLWLAALHVKHIGQDFRPALGFVPRAGIRKYDAALMFKPRPEAGGIRQFTFNVFPQLVTDLDNRVENWSFDISPFEIELDSGDEFETTIIPTYERLSAPFAISPGVEIPSGEFRFTRYEATAGTATKRPWVANFGVGWGGFYSGTRRDLSLELILKPNHHLLLGLRGERNDVRLKEGNFFTQLFSVEANCSFSPDVSWANLVQYDNASRILGFQSRFRWILKPGNDLFLVWNRGWYRDFDRSFSTAFDRGTIKLQYTFRY
jgi:hypothetical protein